MNRARLIAIAKLLLLLGAPAALVSGIVGAGAYVGVTKRATIIGFERDVLGLDVAPVPVVPSASPTPSGTTVDHEPKAAPRESRPGTAEPTPQVKVTAAPAPTPTPAPAPRVDPIPPPAADATQPEPLPTDLADRLAMPVAVRVKVLVDDELIKSKSDWIDYVQRTVAAASGVYEQNFGITLELDAIGRWSVVTAGLGSHQLLNELRTHPREGADVLVGMTARPLDGTIAGEAETPESDSVYNGAYGIVYAVPRAREPHLRTLLHELAHLFGALDVTDPSDAAWQGASWMSYAPVRDGQAPWIDAPNRRRVLERKGKPFAPEPSGAELNPEL